MSNPGMASDVPKVPVRGVSWRISIDDGEPTPINDEDSAWVAGVGIAVVASPKRAFMSSSLTFAVSG